MMSILSDALINVYRILPYPASDHPSEYAFYAPIIGGHTIRLKTDGHGSQNKNRRHNTPCFDKVVF
jgi:hypothetical protein